MERSAVYGQRLPKEAVCTCGQISRRIRPVCHVCDDSKYREYSDCKCDDYTGLPVVYDPASQYNLLK